MKLSLLKHVAIAGRVFDLTFAPGANRLLVVCDEKPTLILDATTGKEIGKLPKGASVAAIDPVGTLAAVCEGGKTVAGRYTWNVSLWDLAKGKKVALLAKSHPDDNLAPEVIGPSRVLALRKKKNAYSFVLFDRAGTKEKELALGKVSVPFVAALSADQRLLAHATFTGAGQLVDAASGKTRKLAASGLTIDRHHEKGISQLSFDATGEYLLAVSHGSELAHVWSTTTGKSLAGSWAGKSVHDAFFSGGSLVLTAAGSREATATVHALGTKARPRVIVVGTAGMLFASAGDDRFLARAGHTGFDAYAKDGLELWDLVSGKRAAKDALPAPMKAVNALAACPGKVAVGDEKGGVALFAYA